MMTQLPSVTHVVLLHVSFSGIVLSRYTLILLKFLYIGTEYSYLQQYLRTVTDLIIPIENQIIVEKNNGKKTMQKHEKHSPAELLDGVAPSF